MDKRVMAVLLTLLTFASFVAATDYTNEYTTTGIKNGILDIIGGVIVGIAGERVTIGGIVALGIIMGLLLGILGGLVMILRRMKNIGK